MKYFMKRMEVQSFVEGNDAASLDAPETGQLHLPIRLIALWLLLISFLAGDIGKLACLLAL